MEFERFDIELIFDNINAEILETAIGYDGTSEEELLDILKNGVEIEKLQSICSHRSATDRVIATAIKNYPILNMLLNMKTAYKESYLAAAKSSSINSEIFDRIENSDILDRDIMLAAFGNGNISAYNLYSMLLIKCSFDPEMSAELARNPSVDQAYIISLLISFAAEHKSGLKELERNGTIKFLNAVIGNPNITDKCFAVIASFYPEFLNDVSIAIFNSPNCGVKGMMTLAWNENTNENVLAAIPKEII